MTGPIIIAEWAKNDHETIRVALDRYRDHDTFDIRVWWTDKAGELKPGRSGITVSIRHLPDIAKAVNAALDEARKRGLI